MNITRWILIGATLILAAIFTFNFYIWSQEYKDQFFYNNDFLSLAMVFIFILAITGIFKWLLKEEILLTKPRGNKR